MKRLLLPLLAAIALPIPVNANPFSGDLILKNNLGEKFLIKNFIWIYLIFIKIRNFLYKD